MVRDLKMLLSENVGSFLEHHVPQVGLGARFGNLAPKIFQGIVVGVEKSHLLSHNYPYNKTGYVPCVASTWRCAVCWYPAPASVGTRSCCASASFVRCQKQEDR